MNGFQSLIMKMKPGRRLNRRKRFRRIRNHAESLLYLKQVFTVLSPVAQKERRIVRRMSVKPQQTLPVVIRCGQGTVCKGRVLNLSAQGMLVGFSKDQVPPVPGGCQSVS